jgi:hypothetical protein
MKDCIELIVGFIIWCIIKPIIIFGAGWFGGWILMNIVCGAVATGLNTLFETTRFMPDIIPVVCGTLAVIGNFFKTTVSKE